MLTVNFNTKEFNKILKNTLAYSESYFQSIELNKGMFYSELATCIQDTMNNYIDSQARMHPERLHHVYEWDMVGKENGRLFKFKNRINQNSITFNGKFLPSKTISQGSREPFVDKARIMENAIAIEISPKNSDVLVFNVGDETVFTPKNIYIAHPGGEEVENGFGTTVSNFFDNYFTFAVLQPILKKMSIQIEYAQNFSKGAKSGSAVGRLAGKEYLSSAVRMEIE